VHRIELCCSAPSDLVNRLAGVRPGGHENASAGGFQVTITIRNDFSYTRFYDRAQQGEHSKV
jgi:hypothetical protein